MKYYNYILISILLVSCKIDSQDIETQRLTLHTDLNVRNLYFQSEDTIYAMGGNLWSGGFLERSIDGGANWDTLLSHWKMILSLEITNNNDIIVGSFYGGIHISRDNGQTFDYHERSEMNAVNDMKLINDSLLFVAGGESFYTGGFSLFNVQNQTYEFNDLEQSLACQYFFDNNNGLVGAYGTIYKTTDGGASLEATDATGDYFKDIEFNNTGKGIAVGYQGKVMKSTNYGNNWEKITKKSNIFTSKGNLESVDVFNNTVVIAGQNGALFLSNDLGNNWMKLNFDYDTHDLYRVFLTSETQGYLCGSDGLLLKFFL